jgi:hypothetical protein
MPGFTSSNGAPVQPPVFVASGQRLNFKVSFSPTRPGTFNDSLTLDSYNLFVSGSTPSGPVTPGQAGVLYGVSDTANNGAILFSIANFSTNPQVNFIGATGLSFPAIAISPVSGIIYAVDPTTGYLFQLDAQSGASGFIGDTGLAQAGAVALACDARGRIFTWGQNDGELYQLDPSSGAASAIGETGYAAGGDLAFDLNGTLYGSTGTDLITINPGSGAATYIGSFQTGSIFGLAIAADGTLYAGQATPGSTGQLYRVDKNNGQLTAVGGALSQSIGDLALFGSSPPRGTANLVPNTPPGWSAPLVVSTSAGSQTDGANLTSTEPLFLSWSLQNQGDLSTFGTFYVDVDLDGSLLHRWEQDNPLSPQGQFSIDGYEFGPISAGTHTLELIPNSANAVGITSSNYTKTIAVSSPGPPPPPPLPPTSTSYYVQAINPYASIAKLQQWAYNMGQAAGLTNLAPTNATPFVILNFGHPYQFSDGTYGATAFSTALHLRVTDIKNIAKQFILGYESKGKCCLTLAVGTTNEEVSLSRNHPFVSTGHAAAWAQMLADLDDWAATQGFPSLNVGSASDAEVGFNSAQVTQDWFVAFAESLQGHAILNYNYGDAAGCANLSGVKPQTCQSHPYKWTQADVANLLAIDVPQIYDNGQALDWSTVSLYQVRHGDGFQIYGALSQYGACTQRARQKPNCATQGTFNMPSDAWTDLVNALSKRAATIQERGQLEWSTDIKWSVH